MKKSVVISFVFVIVLLSSISFVSADEPSFDLGIWLEDLFSSGQKDVLFSDPATEEALAVDLSSCGIFGYASPIAAKANSEYDTVRAAKNAIDNILRTNWFGKKDGYPKWISLDLGEKRCIGSVRVNIYSSDVPITMNLEVSDDGENWLSVKKDIKVDTTDKFIDFGKTVSGRYVRVYETAGKRNFGNLAEAKVNSSSYSGSGGNAIVCTSFEYSEWSECINEMQNRTVISSSPAGCIGGNPVFENKSCNVAECVVKCVDKDGLNYYLESGAYETKECTFVASGAGSAVGFEDKCVSDVILNEAICLENKLATQRATCKNGCVDGACVVKDRDMCDKLSNNNKAKIRELQNNDDFRVILNEGEVAFRGDYVVIYDTEGIGTILKVSEIVNGTANYWDDKVRLRDIASDSSYDATIIGEGIGTFTIKNKKYFVQYFGASYLPADEKYIMLTWEDGASYGLVGDDKDTFNCSVGKIECVDTDRLVDTKEIEVGTSKEIAGLKVYLDYANEYSEEKELLIHASGVINDIYRFSLDSKYYPVSDLTINGIEYILSLVGGSDTSAIIKVDNQGLDYYKQGSVKYSVMGGVALQEDECDARGLGEWICSEGIPEEIIYGCPNGCVNGACLIVDESTQVCSELIDKAKNPKEFVEGGIGFEAGWRSAWEGYTWINGMRESYVEYSASWDNYNKDSSYKSVNYNIQVFRNRNIDLESYLLNRVQQNLCAPFDYYYDENGIADYVYICNWDILNQRQEVSRDDFQEQRQVIWFKDNVLVKLDFYSGRQPTQEEIDRLRLKRIEQFLSDIQNNKQKYIGWENYNLQSPFGQILEEEVRNCESEVPTPKDNKGNECYPSWECKIEPAICPPHGYQTRTCIDYGCDQEREERLYCNPGICAGCYIPRWEGARDNTCIPYGTRLIFSEGDEFQAFEEEMNKELEGIFLLTIKDDSTALIEVVKTLEEDADIIVDGERFEIVEGESFTINEGRTYDVTIESGNYVEEYSVTIQDIVYSENSEKRYIEFVLNNEFPAYCNYDGEIYEQRSKSYDGSGARCQNNYECESNLCSSGECVDVKQVVENTGFIRETVVKIFCRLGSFFSREQTYNQCLIENLGSA